MEGEEGSAGSTTSSAEDGAVNLQAAEKFDEVETIYCRLPKECEYDMKLEHYDDAIQDNSF